MSKKIIIFSGGTGGHVFPAINFGNYLLNKGYECNLVLDKRGKKYSKNFKGKILIINSLHLSGNFYFKVQSIKNLLIGFFQSFFLIFKNKPEICVSFGSYATFMPLIIILFFKLFFKIKIYIHEQNSVIGKVNLFFLPYAENIFTNFSLVKNLEEKYIKKKYHVGLPTSIDYNYNFNKFKKINKKKIIFVYGGSQGSIMIVKIFLSILTKMNHSHLDKVKFIIQCPQKILKSTEDILINLKLDFEIKEFYNKVDSILFNTDLAISRAGSGTINDLIKYKIPAILIPFSKSIYNHQFYNAKYLSDKEAAIIIDENNFDIEINTTIFEELITESKRLEIMIDSLEKIILPNANKKMLNKICT